MMDIRQTVFWSKYLSGSGWQEVRIGHIKAYLYNIPLLGKVMRIPRPSPPIPFIQIDHVARRYNVVFTKIEPNYKSNNSSLHRLFISNGYQVDNWSTEPTKTFCLDLSSSEKELFKQVHHKQRYDIRLAQRMGVKIIESRNVETLYSILKKSAKRKRFIILTITEIRRLWKILSPSKKSKIFLAVYKGLPVAGCFIIFYKSIAHLYLQGFTGDFPKVNAGRFLLWRVILHSKKMGVKTFDFEGGDGGVAFFKKSFGAEEKTLMGSYVKYDYSPKGFFIKNISAINPNIFRLLYRLKNLLKFRTRSQSKAFSVVQPEILLDIDRPRIADQIFSVLKNTAPAFAFSKSHALDIGSSNGVIDKWLMSHFKKIDCLDVDKSAIELGKTLHESKNLHFNLFDGATLPFSDNSVDVIIVRRVYEYVENQKKFISEIYRTLRPGGLVYFEARSRLYPTSRENFLLNYYRTFWELNKHFSNFNISKITPIIIKNPLKYSFFKLFKHRSPLQYLPLRILKLIEPFSPVFIWVLTKPNRSHKISQVRIGTMSNNTAKDA